MSKSIVRQQGQKRKKKTLTRKTLSHKKHYQKSSLENRIIKRVKYLSKNNIAVNAPQLTISEMMSQCSNKVKELLIFHYYLIFIKILIDHKVLLNYSLNYDIIKQSKRIRSINQSINQAPMLEDDIANLEILHIAEDIEKLSFMLFDEISKTKEIEKKITAMIMARGRHLPEKENGLPYSDQEIFNKVLMITAIDYMATNVFNLKPSEE